MILQIHTILIADDDDNIRGVVARRLILDGFEVICATNADEALTLIARCPRISVVVTDIEMPGPMNGLALAEILREHRADMGIVVTSGGILPAEPDLPKSARFIPKPYKCSALSAAISSLIADRMK